MAVRIILYTDSISKSDVNTFEAAAKVLRKDYAAKYSSDNLSMGFVKSGKEIVEELKKQNRNSVISLDIVSHGNQGGIHIARKLTTPIKSGLIQRRAHVLMRESSDRPQTPEDAKMMEESMHGLYANWSAKKGVSYYYNQSDDHSSDIAVLKDIDFSIFCENSFVEFHGCRTAEYIPGFNTYFHDNFAKQFSEMLPKNSMVVGHITNSNPNKSPSGKSSDYRHGNVRSYREGKLVHDVVQRTQLRFQNSSTP